METAHGDPSYKLKPTKTYDLVEMLKTQLDKALSNLIYLRSWLCFEEEVGLGHVHTFPSYYGCRKRTR